MKGINRGAMSVIMMTLLSVGLFTSVVSIRLPTQVEMILINLDGSVTGTTKIERNGNIYTFTDNIYDKYITAYKNHIIIDGANYTLEGPGNGIGISVNPETVIRNAKIMFFDIGITLDVPFGSCNVTNCEIVGNSIGIDVDDSVNNTISGSRFAKNTEAAIKLIPGGNETTICGNILENNQVGISIVESSGNEIYNNSIIGNQLRHNDYGMLLYNSAHNKIYENEITSNTWGIVLQSTSANNTVGPGNNITVNKYAAEGGGILLEHSPTNEVYGNSLTKNIAGIKISSSSYNAIHENNISANYLEGVKLEYSEHNSVYKNIIMNNDNSIYLHYADNSHVQYNVIMDNAQGIYFQYTNSSTIQYNSIIMNTHGICLYPNSSRNVMYGNTIAHNEIGITSHNTSHNHIYHNDFVNNTFQTNIIGSSKNFWNDDTLKEGNYWSEYKGFDENGDGIVDAPYIIDIYNQDNFPLICPARPVPFFWKETRQDCCFISNATVSMFDFDHDSKSIGLEFSLANKNGYCIVTVPKTLLKGAFRVLVVGIPIASMLTWNETHTSIYFEATIPPFSEYTTYNVNIIADVVTSLTGDINNDGFVDIFDVVLMAKHFGEES